MVIDAIILGAALHTDPHTRNYNPGLGIELEMVQDEPVTIYAGYAKYRDSYVHQAEVGGIGFRYLLLGDNKIYHAGIDLLFGYAHMTHWTGPVVLPSVYAGYNHINAHVAMMSADSLGFYLRYEVILQ